MRISQASPFNAPRVQVIFDESLETHKLNLASIESDSEEILGQTVENQSVHILKVQQQISGSAENKEIRITPLQRATKLVDETSLANSGYRFMQEIIHDGITKQDFQTFRVPKSRFQGAFDFSFEKNMQVITVNQTVVELRTRGFSQTLRKAFDGFLMTKITSN
jgi:hypothetical protein